MKLWFTKGIFGVSKKSREKAEGLSREQVRNVAVIRHAALGDMVLTRAFLVEARQAFKNANITLSIASHYTRGAPVDLVDRVHVVHGSDQRGTPLMKRIRRMRELGPQDIIFDLACTNRSLMTCLVNPATLKIGFPYRKSQARLFYDVAVCRSDLNFEVNDMLAMLNVFGIKTAYPHVYDMPGDPLKRDRPYIVYFPGASTAVKCWPADHFTRLVRELSTVYPAHDHLVLEGLREWESARAILEPLRDLKNTAPVRADTVEETTALLKGADLVVSNDTGIRHVAIVSETPTVGIFWADPFRYWPRYGAHEIVIPDPEWPPPVDRVKTACLDALRKINGLGP
jgi:ADP-heptose:LPS heptosyltransferase